MLLIFGRFGREGLLCRQRLIEIVHFETLSIGVQSRFPAGRNPGDPLCYSGFLPDSSTHWEWLTVTSLYFSYAQATGSRSGSTGAGSHGPGAWRSFARPGAAALADTFRTQEAPVSSSKRC